MAKTIKSNTVNKPYFDVPFLPYEDPTPDSRHGAHYFRNVKQLQVGFGSEVFRVDRDGMWAGSEVFADAPWKVYWNGRMEATDLVLGGYLAEGDAIGDVQTSIGAGGLSAITANIGTITAGSITGVTITGGTVRTSASGKRVEMTGNEINIYNSSNVLVGTFSGLTGTYASAIQVTVAEIDVMALADSGASSTVGAGKDGVVVVDTGDLYVSTRKADNSGGNVALKAGTSNSIVSFNNLRPNADNTHYLGTSVYGWARVYIGGAGRYLVDNAGTLEWNGSPLGQGTVTSIATSGAITGGTITSTGTISHSTASGYKHVPAGGGSDQYLKYSADGTATWSYLGGSNCTSLIPSGATVTLGNSSFYWDEAYVEDVRTNNLYDRNAGYITVNDDIRSSSTGNDLGSSGSRFGTVYAVSIDIIGNAQVDGDLSVQDIYFDSKSGTPTVEGQFFYFDDGVSQEFRANAGSFQGSVDLTAL